jgi:hypothetical protein
MLRNREADIRSGGRVLADLEADNVAHVQEHDLSFRWRLESSP